MSIKRDQIGAEETNDNIKEQILECFMYISVVGLGVTAAEKFATPK